MAMSEEEVVEVFRTTNAAEAVALTALLQEAGIESLVSQETMGGVMGEHAPDLAITIRERDRDQAAPLLDEFRRMVFEHAERPTDDSEPADEPRIAGTVSMSACPACGQTRRGTCSYCGADSAGFVIHEFDLVPDGPGGQVGQLVCPVCHEPTIPKWQSTCSRCARPFSTY